MMIIFLGVMIIFDLFISSIISSDFSWQTINFLPMMSLFFIVFIMIRRPSNRLLLYAFFTGLMVDLMSHSLLFTHAILYVIVVIILHEFQRHVSTSLLEIILMGMIAVVLKETILFAWYAFTSVTNISILHWYSSRLILTMIGNIPFMFIAYYSSNMYLKRLDKNIKKQQQSETTLWGFLKE